MRTAGCICALLLGFALACSDPATIGGLCRTDCNAVDAASASECAVDECMTTVDAGKIDAGALDAGPMCRDAVQLTRMRLDLVLVIDDTASVVPWLPALYDGLAQFLNASASSGIGVGLQRFDDICDAQEYEKLLVPIAPLPGNASAVQDALAPIPTASTSTTPALDGVLRYARSWATSHPEARVAVVLLTDGSPGACDGLVGDFDAEAQRIAREGYQGTPSIKTYVVGVGSMDTVNLVARAGGTEPMPISVAPADGEVLAALDNVRQDALPCGFAWDAGWMIAPDSVVVATASDGAERRYPIHRDATACDQQDGFYTGPVLRGGADQDATSGFALVACPRSCAEIAADDQLTLSTACAAP